MAMRYANEGIIPPKEWQHDPLITNVCQYTIATILAIKGILPPEYWIISEN